MLASMVMLINGCTISKKECLQGDWQTIGYKDGRSGHSADIINSYAKSCAKHGTSPDPVAYTAGFNAGIVLYCTPANGYEQGRRINDYVGSCPADLEKPFVAKYLHGLRVTGQALEFDYDRERFELDVLRDRRDRKRDADELHADLDKQIKQTRRLLREIIQKRELVSQKAERWQRFSH